MKKQFDGLKSTALEEKYKFINIYVSKYCPTYLENDKMRFKNRLLENFDVKISTNVAIETIRVAFAK